ncbi:MAG: molybdopterin dinucleotide binding domain-containing protein [Eggerthellaceae bacterium]
MLPATTRFELDAKVGNAKVGYNQLVLQNKVIDPLFEARTDFWIQKEFARRLGAEDALPADSVELVDAIISGAEDPEISALTVDRINENNGAWPLPGIEEPRQEFADFAFATASGRLDLYYENLVAFGQALPAWEPPIEAWRDNEKRAEYPLQLANVRTRFHIHNQFNDALWIQQYFEPTLDANPVDLEARGLATGDAVEVFNDRGSFEGRARQPIHPPGSARLCEGATADYLSGQHAVRHERHDDRAATSLCAARSSRSRTRSSISGKHKEAAS